MLGTNYVRPMVVLEGHDGVEDISFRNNYICVSAGQDGEVGVWDLRVGRLQHKIRDIHLNDINAISCKSNYIVSGGEEGRINIID